MSEELLESNLDLCLKELHKFIGDFNIDCDGVQYYIEIGEKANLIPDSLYQILGDCHDVLINSLPPE